MLDFDSYEVLTFDCYGTLIDWESGILGALRPVLARHDIDMNDDALLETYAGIEAGLEAGEHVLYAELLRRLMRELAARLGFEATGAELDCISASIKDWQPFPDTIAALRKLKGMFKLAVVSNIDDDLFKKSAARLRVPFDWVITAEQAGSYKPSHKNFQLAFETIGFPRKRFLHVAQSLYHDIVPARELGVANVWVNRRKGRDGHGATHPASATPDLEVADLDELTKLIGL
jgi:2-haloacid dehalogenase